ncbi:MAG: hypothetical protein KVP17_004875 [Porospora cf. gigantea B]|uniref:uncharacterized protein n=1 Tax=Porospora cf. gigantea B TaxID=2853592 RepID=UPI003571F17D|nr:MAG: hypothetical protein KVP17_004875 [Porospora cf. gigantea B]
MACRCMLVVIQDVDSLVVVLTVAIPMSYCLTSTSLKIALKDVCVGENDQLFTMPYYCSLAAVNLGFMVGTLVVTCSRAVPTWSTFRLALGVSAVVSVVQLLLCLGLLLVSSSGYASSPSPSGPHNKTRLKREYEEFLLRKRGHETRSKKLKEEYTSFLTKSIPPPAIPDTRRAKRKSNLLTQLVTRVTGRVDTTSTTATVPDLDGTVLDTSNQLVESVEPFRQAEDLEIFRPLVLQTGDLSSDASEDELVPLAPAATPGVQATATE